MKLYTTRQAAKAVGISRQTLQTWIATGKCRAPEVKIYHGAAYREWRASDIAKLRGLKGKYLLKPGAAAEAEEIKLRALARYREAKHWFDKRHTCPSYAFLTVSTAHVFPVPNP